MSVLLIALVTVLAIAGAVTGILLLILGRAINRTPPGELWQDVEPGDDTSRAASLADAYCDLEYAERTGQITQAEWARQQGRLNAQERQLAYRDEECSS